MNSSQVFSIGAGRGRVINKPIKLRRPGQFEAKQQSEHMKQIETLLNELTLVGLEDKSIYTLIGKIKVHCDSGSDVELLVNLVYKFCTESADNAKIGAILSYHLGDFSAEDKKFRTELLRKIQHDFGERNIVFAQTEKFVQNIIIICELFQYLRLMNGEKIVVLINPIAEYLEMLLRNKTNLEIETFAEQIQKCHKEIKQHQPEKFENLLMKIRTTIITSPSESTRALLLQVFEQILLGGEEMNLKLFEFYELHCIQGKIVD